jgi:hypothetical protein
MYVRVFRSLALSGFLFSTQVFPQAAGQEVRPPSIEVSAEPRALPLGQPFVLHLSVTHEATQRIELKAPGDLGDFEFLKQTRQRANDTQTTFDIELSAFALGKQSTPAFQLEVSEPTGTSLLAVPVTDIEVLSTLPASAQKDGEDLFDVKKPEEALVRTWRILWALLVALIVGVTAYALMKYMRRPKVEVPILAPAPEPLPVRTRKALDELRDQKLPDDGRFKEYYFRLSEIVRGYLGERFEFEALESTTPELIDALKKKAPAGLNLSELSQFAHESDFARYAKGEPSKELCDTHLQVAYRIVHSTTAPTRTEAERKS